MNNLWHTGRHVNDDELYLDKFYKFKKKGSGLTEASYMEHVNCKFKVKDQRAVYKLIEIKGGNLTFEESK